MKAVVFEKYGGPEVLKLKDMPKPKPKEGEVLIKLHASSINDWDWQALRGIPFANRFFFGLFKPNKHPVLGCDIAGVVASTGKGVKKFKKGDAVFGDISSGNWGGFSEYTTADENLLARKPDTISFEQAAAIPQAGVIAIQSLRHIRHVKKGETILINGAGGGSGSFTIQMAVNMGAEVTGVDNKHKQDLMKDLGAKQVLDYKKIDYTTQGIEYDRIIDHVAKRPLSHMRRALKSGGVGTIVGGDMSVIFSSYVLGGLGKKKFSLLIMKADPKDLKRVAKMVEKGTIQPTIDKVYPLEDTRKAMNYFGKGLHKGKVVIKICNNQITC